MWALTCIFHNHSLIRRIFGDVLRLSADEQKPLRPLSIFNLHTILSQPCTFHSSHPFLLTTWNVSIAYFSHNKICTKFCLIWSAIVKVLQQRNRELQKLLFIICHEQCRLDRICGCLGRQGNRLLFKIDAFVSICSWARDIRSCYSLLCFFFYFHFFRVLNLHQFVLLQKKEHVAPKGPEWCKFRPWCDF